MYIGSGIYVQYIRVLLSLNCTQMYYIHMCCTHRYMYLFHAVFQLNLAWKTRLRFLLAFTTLTLFSPPSLSFTCVYFKLFPFVALTTFLSNWSLPLSLSPLLLGLRLYIPNYLCTHIYSCLFPANISKCTRFPRV